MACISSLFLLIICCQIGQYSVLSLNITQFVFGENTKYLPAAFGDFNSDKLTDMFVVTQDGRTLKVLMSHAESPLFREPDPPEGPSCTYKTLSIVSVVPGDFDGNGAMDVMIVSLGGVTKSYDIYFLWGSLRNMTLECGFEDSPLLKLSGQPLVMDMNGDMIPDLFGEDENGTRKFWVFGTERKPPTPHLMFVDGSENHPRLKIPSSHAFVDLNSDLAADLWITAKTRFEIWITAEGVYQLNETIDFPPDVGYIGQTSFADVNLDGNIDAVVPVCFDKNKNVLLCKKNSIFIYDFIRKEWIEIDVIFEDPLGNAWSFATSSVGYLYTETTTLRVGDFNLDGYPDLLVTLFDLSEVPRVVLLENIKCSGDSCKYHRSFAPKWDLFKDFGKTVLGTFFDFQEDGTLDVLLVQKTSDHEYQLGVYKDSTEYDAVFVKVLIPTGRCYGEDCALNNIAYGTNQPGPSITYSITTATGSNQCSKATQLHQSAHHSLQLPYTVFGLGRNWNFVEVMKVGIPRGNNSVTLTSSFTQIIPNSQLIVIPYPKENPDRWVSKLFITPSKAMLMTAGALIGTCLFVAAIIGVLHHREKQQDKREKQQEAHKFHFDAM